jgi:MOSC domain-containing protein YiiM
MAEHGEDWGPRGDASRHLPGEALEAHLRALPAAPRERGCVTLIVLRRPDGVRETPARVWLSPEEGVPGDRWGRRSPEKRDAQLAVMCRAVAEVIANGQPLTVFGDNLFVDLDVSAENLPLGTRLRLGSAVVEVSPKPHDGCHKFKARFGGDALRAVQAPETRSQNRRGIYWTVVEAGECGVGDAVEVLAR